MAAAKEHPPFRFDPADPHSKLATVGFAEPPRAAGALEKMFAGLPQETVASLLPSLLLTLSRVAEPDRAVIALERFLDASSDPALQLRELGESPRLVEVLITLFAGSQFLTEILLREPTELARLRPSRQWVPARSAAAFEAELRDRRAACEDERERWRSLRAFQSQELLRIGVGDLLGILDLPTITGQLSLVASTLVNAGLELSRDGAEEEGLCVIALGKLGGAELNYSSDIDLVFVSSGDGQDHWPATKRLVDGLGHGHGDGFLYRVDLRLRPWGRDGALVTSVASYLDYLAKHAATSELQALLKARPIAGDLEVGRHLLEDARPLLLEASPARLRQSIRTLKRRIEGDLKRQGRSWGQVKAGRGSIRDVEFVTQYLQLLNGSTHPQVLVPNTLEALSRLFGEGLLDAGDFRVLVEGYVFMRTVEHYLQIMHYSQVHTLPTEAAAQTSLAHRLRFHGPHAGERFRERYLEHSEAIRQVYSELLESTAEATTEVASPGAPRALVGMPASYEETFTSDEIERHRRLAKRLSDEQPVLVETHSVSEGKYRVSIVGYELLGELSLISGLLFTHGFNIVDGEVFTSAARSPSKPSAQAGRRRGPHAGPGTKVRETIVDVFTVSQTTTTGESALEHFGKDLLELVRRLERQEHALVQAELAKRIALAMGAAPSLTRALYPIDISIDNLTDPDYTVLRIEADDTVGFLYEITSALALERVSVKRMTVHSTGERLTDTLYVCDQSGAKIVDEQRLQQLRAATVLTKHVTHLLPRSPNPESALLHFREFLGDLFRSPDWPTELTSLERPEVLENLVRLLGISDFLWDDFLRMQHANLFPLLGDVSALKQVKDRRALRREAGEAIAKQSRGEDWRGALNAFKDREMFRIDMRQIQGHIETFEEFSAELSDLAEVVFERAFELCCGELEARYGYPQAPGSKAAPIAVCALGKFGGCELGYASDFELIFVYAGEGVTRGGNESISDAEFFSRLVDATRRSLVGQREGIFEIDLRLRPYGEAGPLAVSLEAFRDYFSSDGDAWEFERQALIKLRPVAGDRPLGERIVRLRDELIFTPDPPDLAASRAMRERQLRHLVKPGTINAKYSAGGLVDLEYLVQLLQLTHGYEVPELRVPHTLAALEALERKGLIDGDDYRHLIDAYRFYRRLIDGLRIVRGHAKDLTVPPEGSEELAFLSRRLNEASGEEVARQLNLHGQQVRALNERLLPPPPIR